MANNQITPQQLQALIQYASKKLGMSPEELAKTVNSGGAESLVSKLSPGDAAKLKSAVGGSPDQKKIEQLVSSPEAQALIQSLLKKQ